MNRIEAERVDALVRAIFDGVNDLLHIVNSATEGEARGKAQKALGVVLAELDLEILEPIYRQFPDLRPPEMPEVLI